MVIQMYGIAIGREQQQQYNNVRWQERAGEVTTTVQEIKNIKPPPIYESSPTKGLPNIQASSFSGLSLTIIFTSGSPSLAAAA
jgi:hypothetical protein